MLSEPVVCRLPRRLRPAAPRWFIGWHPLTHAALPFASARRRISPRCPLSRSLGPGHFSSPCFGHQTFPHHQSSSSLVSRITVRVALPPISKHASHSIPISISIITGCNRPHPYLARSSRPRLRTLHPFIRALSSSWNVYVYVNIPFESDGASISEAPGARSNLPYSTFSHENV